jgi:tetratricopeptide (TPR) repeat protein
MTNGAIGQILREAEELLKREDYTGAIALLGKIDLDAASVEQKALYNLLHANANHRFGNHQVEDRLESALNYYRSRDDGKYALGKLLQGLMLMARGEFSDAEGAFIEAYGVYKRCDDYNGQGWATNRLAAIAFCTGDYGAAIEHLEKCIELHTQNRDRERRWSAARNLAYVLAACGKLEDSLALFAKEEEHIQKRDPRNVCKYYLMRSIPHALLNEIDTAREMLRKVEPLIDQFVRERAIYYECQGWIYNLEGDYDKAVEALRQSLEVLLEIGSESVLVSQIKRLTADAYVGLGELDMARNFADEALFNAEKFHMRAEIAACHRVYGPAMV